MFSVKRKERTDNMVKIIADSTCDLSQELIKRYDITILPLHILLGEEEYEDGTEITPDEIYRWSDEHKTTPKTSAVSIDKTAEAFRSCVDNGNEVVCFSVSGKMSTTCNVMRLAAEMLDEKASMVQAIDSESLSTGGGLLVIEAALMAQKGCSAAEIADEINQMRAKVRASFVVDTLTYLHRGGRCSGLTAMAGSALKLHPRIDVTDGSMTSGKKYRGKMDKVIMSYVTDMVADLKKARKGRVFITHSGCSPEILDQVHQYLAGLGVFEEILTTRAGGVISSHCGPGTLGVLYIEA